MKLAAHGHGHPPAAENAHLWQTSNESGVQREGAKPLTSSVFITEIGAVFFYGKTLH